MTTTGPTSAAEWLTDPALRITAAAEAEYARRAYEADLAAERQAAEAEAQGGNPPPCVCGSRTYYAAADDHTVICAANADRLAEDLPPTGAAAEAAAADPGGALACDGCLDGFYEGCEDLQILSCRIEGLGRPTAATRRRLRKHIAACGWCRVEADLDGAHIDDCADWLR